MANDEKVYSVVVRSASENPSEKVANGSGKFNLWLILPVLINASLLIVNAGLFIVTKRSAEAAMSSANTAAETLVLSQRASLYVANWRLENINVGAEPKIRYRIFNAGRSPAHIDKIRFGLQVGKLPNRPDYQDEISRFGAPVAPGSWLDQPQEIPVAQARMLGAISLSGKNWWYYIRIEYSDHFGSHAYCTLVRANKDATDFDVNPAENYICDE